MRLKALYGRHGGGRLGWGGGDVDPWGACCLYSDSNLKSELFVKLSSSTVCLGSVIHASNTCTVSMTTHVLRYMYRFPHEASF